LLSLIYSVYNMGEGDWKSIMIEDPAGQLEKK
jgi:hypothetical protein